MYTVDADGVYRQRGCEDVPLEMCVRQSWLVPFRQSPLHLYDRYLAHDADTGSSAAQALGTAVHCAILEPEKFDRRYVIVPKIDRTSHKGLDAGIVWYMDRLSEDTSLALSDEMSSIEWLLTVVGAERVAELKNIDLTQVAGKRVFLATLETLSTRTPITSEQMEMIRLMQAGVQCAAERECIIFPQPGALTETTLVWQDEATGVYCRGTIDYMMPPDRALIWDLKTTRCAAREAFQMSAWKFGYFEQAAMYQDGYLAVFGVRAPYGWALVENARPHAAAFYVAGEAELAYGRRRYRELLPQIARCLETNDWPGYETGLQELGLPLHVERAERWLSEQGLDDLIDEVDDFEF